MNDYPSLPSSLVSLLAAAALLTGAPALLAQAPKSLLPAFSPNGAEVTVKAQGGNELKGWLPNGWVDNSEWAEVSATYSKLEESPEPGAGALRITVGKVDAGQLQLTTYGGNQNYKKGVRYVVTGWLRSPDPINVYLGIRQIEDPYEFYHEEELSPGAEWKRFEFAFTPEKDLTAFVMFALRAPGTVDVAGLAAEAKP